MKGFTLLEVMIALAIMAGVVLTVITSFNYHLSIAARDREETIATLLARAKLEEPGFTNLERKSGTFAPDWPEMGWEADLAPTDFPGVNRLTLRVIWDDRRKSLVFVRYLAK
ncbi:MAG: prepilin-type N-terminal cleavage/methylation domain-containing protein [Geobacteraceae bacterium]|nr:prepilin-type N-terminal cleavage/methylation domain-containing protein [Geobacteraceae bacterium]